LYLTRFLNLSLPHKYLAMKKSILSGVDSMLFLCANHSSMHGWLATLNEQNGNIRTKYDTVLL
jgi:hypothetical protein